jgi:hypothetical protein
MPSLKHQKIPSGFGKDSGKFDAQRDQHAKDAAQWGKTEILEGEPEPNSTHAQSVERTARVVVPGHAGSEEVRHHDATEKQRDDYPAKELQHGENPLDYLCGAAPVCRQDS